MADAGSVVWIQPLSSVERRRAGSGEIQSKHKRMEKTEATQGTPAVDNASDFRMSKRVVLWPAEG